MPRRPTGLECGGRQPLAQVSGWRAEVAFSRPEADQAVCCQALLALTGKALGTAGSE